MVKMTMKMMSKTQDNDAQKWAPLVYQKHAVVKLVHSDSGSSSNATIRNTVGMTLTHNSRFHRQPTAYITPQ